MRPAVTSILSIKSISANITLGLIFPYTMMLIASLILDEHVTLYIQYWYSLTRSDSVRNPHYFQTICEMSGWKSGSEKYNQVCQLFVELWRNLQDCGDGDLDGRITQDEWVGHSSLSIVGVAAADVVHDTAQLLLVGWSMHGLLASAPAYPRTVYIIGPDVDKHTQEDHGIPEGLQDGSWPGVSHGTEYTHLVQQVRPVQVQPLRQSGYVKHVKKKWKCSHACLHGRQDLWTVLRDAPAARWLLPVVYGKNAFYT